MELIDTEVVPRILKTSNFGFECISCVVHERDRLRLSMGLWKFYILVIVLGRRGFTTLLILLTWMTEQPFHSPQAPLLTVYSVSSPLASAGEAVGQALWQGWASEQRSVGGCICAKWLGGGCAQHDASPACPPLPLQWWWVLLGLGNPQIFCVSSIPVCCSDVKWDRSFHLR